MMCRHCLVEFHSNWTLLQQGIRDANGPFIIGHVTCPACDRAHIGFTRNPMHEIQTFLYPRAMAREPLGAGVPNSFTEDYQEACNILELSPKSSAALSRRILQHVLHECAKIKDRTLDLEIQKALDQKIYPAYIADALDSVRTLGNFAVHPIKSTSTGEIVDVEEGEAEWTLDTVEALFDFHFVQPAKTKAKRDALDAKLADAKKPSLRRANKID